MIEREIVVYWLEKAEQDLASAKENLSAGRLQNSVGCLFRLLPFLFSSADKAGRTFRKHSEVRSILHRDYVKGKKLAVEWGKHYDCC